ncbi:gonadoliberin III, partial [Vibrio anguillarum]|uniref:UUP1 family membrane protein n=1 Tax=Vibrio anguillarum TaxID=55601 RepID=UPI00188C284B
TTDTGKRVEWSIRKATRPQTIYYKSQFLVDPQAKADPIPPMGDVVKPTFDGPEEAAAIALIERANQRSADNITFTRELIKNLNDADSQNAS